MEDYGLEDYISYDLGMVSRYQYYTGVIFKGYTYGTGDYIVTGGRYDRLLEQFGKDSPAVGFAVEVDRVLSALSRQQIDLPVSRPYALILFEADAQTAAIRLAKELRSQLKPVITSVKRPDSSMEEYKRMARERKISRIFYLTGTDESAELLTMEDGL